MSLRKCICQLILLFLTSPILIMAGTLPSSDASNKSNKQQQQQQQQQQYQQQPKFNSIQDAQLNTLNVYATNYEILSNKQNQNDKFKPSQKLPQMETNFTPIHNSNSIAPEFASTLASPAPVLMQYLPQTINEGGVQYLQLIPTRPLMVPIGPYLNSNSGLQSLTYHQHLAPTNSIEYAPQPIISSLPVNMPPPIPTPAVEVPASPLPSYGIQTYSGAISPYKQNHRINRETKDKQLLGPINLNLNEYIPAGSIQQQVAYNLQERS